MQIGKIISPHDLRGATIDRSNSITRGLVGAWQPNVFPAGNTLYDRSGYGNDGAISGATRAADGEMGHVLSFDGNDSVTVPNQPSINPTDAITIAGWVYPTDLTTPSYGTLVYKNHQVQWALVVDYSVSGAFGNLVRFMINIGGTRRDFYSNSAGLSLNAWNHLAATFDGSTARIYQDAVVRSSSSSYSGAIGTSSSNLVIGGNILGSPYYIGLIGQVTIYNRALSAAEIASLYADPYQIWDVGEDEMEWAKAAAAAGNPHYYYQMLSKRRAS